MKGLAFAKAMPTNVFFLYLTSASVVCIDGDYGRDSDSVVVCYSFDQGEGHRSNSGCTNVDAVFARVTGFS